MRFFSGCLMRAPSPLASYSVIMSRHFAYLFFIALLVLLPASCGKDNRHPVPNVPVEFTINIESTQYIELNAINSFAYFSGGYKGIIIYRWQVDVFLAFDRACPYHPYDECARIVVTDPPMAQCPCCDSKFLLIDGSVYEGPSRFPLKQYRTYFQYPFLQVTSW